MNNFTIFEQTDSLTGQITEYVWIDQGNGEFTSMTKAHYEAIQAEQSTPNLAGLFNE